MKRWQGLLVLVALIALLAYLIEPIGEESAEREAPARIGDEPDLLMQDATITQFNDDGTLRYRLRAAEIRHSDQDDTTQVDAPALEVHRAPQPPWLLVARSGDIRQSDTAAGNGKTEEVVHLTDDVQLTRDLSDGFVKLTTQALNVYPERRFAATDRAVIIDTNAGRTEAAGLSGDLDKGLLKLSSDASQRVHTIVLPNQFKRATARARP